jgi:SAM-dependent methyltransferase
MDLRSLFKRLRELPYAAEQALGRLSLIEQQIHELRTVLEVEQANRKLLTSDIEVLATSVTDMQGALANSIAGMQATLANSIASTQGTLANSIASTQGTLANSLNATENVLLGRFSLMQGQIETIGAQLTTVLEALAGFEHRMSTRNGEISNEVNALHNAVLLQAQDRVSLAQGTAELNATFGIRHGEMANEVNAILNAVLPQSQGVQAIERRLEQSARYFDEARAVDAGLNMLMARGISALIARTYRNPASRTAPVALPKSAATIADQMTAMKQIAPLNFSAWHATYQAGVAEGLRTTEGNLSHEGHYGAGHFRMFVDVHARGRVLDVGCGPIALPSYLSDWPIDALAGIDPQLPFEPHPFPFAQSFAESIPWPDSSFETVVIGTSLDHVYLLDQALAEIKRVLVPGGRLLIWTAIFDETPRYIPKGPKFDPPDSYHLFHPGRNWFYELFQSDYRMIERIPSIANAELLAYELKSGGNVSRPTD